MYSYYCPSYLSYKPLKTFISIVLHFVIMQNSFCDTLKKSLNYSNLNRFNFMAQRFHLRVPYKIFMPYFTHSHNFEYVVVTWMVLTDTENLMSFESYAKNIGQNFVFPRRTTFQSCFVIFFLEVNVTLWSIFIMITYFRPVTLSNHWHWWDWP